MQRNSRVAAVLGLLLLAALLLWWQLGERTEPSGVTEVAGPVAEQPGQDLPANRVEVSSETQRRRAEAPQAPSKPLGNGETGSLLLRVIYGDDDSRAAHIGVFVREVTRQGPVRRRRLVMTDGEVRGIDQDRLREEINSRATRIREG